MMKISEEEFALLTGTADYCKASARFLELGPKLLAVTLGSEGVLIVTAQKQEKVAGFRVQAVDTTGAGDSFWGGFLSRYLKYKKNFQDLTWEEIKKCALYGNDLCNRKGPPYSI